MTLLAIAACAWEPPIDRNAPPQLGAIEGTVVFDGTGPVGPTFITVYSADNPGAPVGTGSPVTFAAVSPNAFSDPGSGLRSAPFGVTQLPANDYLVNTLVDVDANFSVFSDLLAGATCGDSIGTHVTDLTTLGTSPVTVVNGEATREVTVLAGVEMTTERPAFEFVSDTELSLTTAAESPFPPVYRLRATSISTALAEDLPLELGPACNPDPDLTCESEPACNCDDVPDPCSTALWVYAPDTDGDGEADPYPAELQASNGIENVFPRVYVEYIGEALPLFEFEGEMLPERWVGEHFPLLTEITVSELAGGSAASVIPIGVPVPMSELNITMSPVFRHYHEDGTFDVDANGPYDLLDLRLKEYVVSDVPAGVWRTTVILHTGQTWNLPNDIAALELPGPATQGETLTLVP